MTDRSVGYAPYLRSPDPVEGVDQILFVCHANQCRSPYAEAIARRMAGDASVRFSSAGLISGGRPMPSLGRSVAPEFGLDFDAHRSRELDLFDFAGFDLILTMARAQARELVVADPDAWPRIFTLKQFARWIVDNPRSPRAALGPWLDAAAGGRPRATILGSSVADDIADPLRAPEAAWREMVDDLTVNLSAVVAGISRA